MKESETAGCIIGWKAFGSKQLWFNSGIIPEFVWKN
jgi:hypothetical protein